MRRPANTALVRTIVAEAIKDKEKKRVQRVITDSSLDTDLQRALEVMLLYVLV